MDLKDNPHVKHRDRMRERFLRDGIGTFNDHEKLELMLYYSVPVRDTNKTAHALLEHCGGTISGVFETSVKELCKVPGVGYNTAVMIKLFQAMTGVYLDDKVNTDDVLDTKEKMADFVKYKFVDKPVEHLLVVCLDCRKRVINYEFASKGTVNATQINNRVISEIALKYNASSVIIAHNHPQGYSLASRNDKYATEVIEKTLNIFGIGLDDSFVVAENKVYSLRNNRIIIERTDDYDSEMSE